MITLTLKQQPTVPLEAESVSPDVLVGLDHAAIRALPVYLGKRSCRLDEFFDVINELTPGLTVTLQSVDLKTKEVTVHTDDGDIPIEAISQGTTSLIGWIGILLQRLYEVYGDSENPRGKYALVLIDEIDAHMHPSWQQTIAPALKRIFPNVQFIASTHSPLIVTELSKDQVLVVRRDPDTGAFSGGQARFAPGSTATSSGDRK